MSWMMMLCFTFFMVHWDEVTYFHMCLRAFNIALGNELLVSAQRSQEGYLSNFLVEQCEYVDLLQLGLVSTFLGEFSYRRLRILLHF